MGPGACFKMLAQGQEGAAVGESLGEGRRLAAAAAGAARGLGTSSRNRERQAGARNYRPCIETGVLWEHGSTYLEGGGAGNRGRPSPCACVATSASFTCSEPEYEESADSKARVKSSDVLSAKEYKTIEELCLRVCWPTKCFASFVQWAKQTRKDNKRKMGNCLLVPTAATETPFFCRCTLRTSAG